jgi:hypothetical protein
MEHSTSSVNGTARPDSPPQTGKMIVAGDGSAYVAYEYSAVTSGGSTGPPWFAYSLYGRWMGAHKSAELHIYAKGGRGFAMRKQNLPGSLD